MAEISYENLVVVKDQQNERIHKKLIANSPLNITLSMIKQLIKLSKGIKVLRKLLTFIVAKFVVLIFSCFCKLIYSFKYLTIVLLDEVE